MTDIGRLFIVATPIGNPNDITLRAIEVLSSVDAIIVEERRQAAPLLKRLKVNPKELLEVNEHNETEASSAILIRLFQGQNMALISDCGTPVFADPGHYLIEQAVNSGISVTPVPGASSLTAALSILDFDPKQFIFAGFLPRERMARLREMQRLRGLGMTVVIMDTPYRLGAVMEDALKVFGKNQAVTLACDLTLSSEKIFRGTISEVRQQAGQRKAEFVLIIKASAK